MTQDKYVWIFEPVYVHIYGNIYVISQIYVEFLSTYMLTYRKLTFI